MIEFISLLVSYMLMAIADSVDNAFGNSISLDAVVVVGCISSISLVTRSLARMGAYYYRVVRVNDIKCIQMDFISGLVCGTVVFLLKDFIVGLYDITPVQKELFRSVIIQWSLYLPFYGAGTTSFEIVRLRNELSTYNKGLLYHYILLILTDAIVYFTTRSLPMMYAATALCQMSSIAYFYIKMKYKFERIDLTFIRDVMQYGIPIAVERFISGAALMLYGTLASRMDNVSYAIHSVCYGAADLGTQITNAYNAALMIKLPMNKSYDESLKGVYYWAKKMLPLMLIAYVSYAMISLGICHGKVEFKDCFPWYIFYMFELIGLYIYENFKVLCLNQKYVRIFPVGVTAGFTFRMLICIIGLRTSIPLVFFGLGQSFDWACRGIVYYTALKHNKTKT